MKSLMRYSVVLTVVFISTSSLASPPKVSPQESGKVVEAQDGTLRYEFPMLTDEYVRTVPLDELSVWISKQNGDAARAFYRKRNEKQNKLITQQVTGFVCSGPVMITARPDVLSSAHWDIVAERIRSALVDPDMSTVKSASTMLFQISQSLRGDQNRQVVGQIYRDGQLLKLIKQLDDDDIQTRISRLSMAGASMYTIPPMSTEECFKILDRLETASYVRKQSEGIVPTRLELREVQSLTSILSSWRFRNPDIGEIDEEFAHRIIQLADPLPHDDEQARAIRFLLAQAYGAPKIVMEYVTELYSRDDPIAKGEALRILGRQVSIYDNKNPASRSIVMHYAIPIYRDRAKTPFTDEQSQCILMDVAGSGRAIGPDAVQLLDVYLNLLEIDDEFIRPMAITSIGALGSAAHSALPRLKELAAQGGIHEESIRDAIYFIAKEGPKPSWYDNYIEQLKEAGVEIE